MKRVATLIASYTVCAFAHATEIDFKGLKLGATIDDVRSHSIAWSCSPSLDTPSSPSRFCRPADTCRDVRDYVERGVCEYKNRLTYAARPLKDASIHLARDKVTSIRLTAESAFFAVITEALTTKHGAPTKSTETSWQNKAGTTFPNIVITWNGSNGTLTATQRGSRVDELRIEMTAPLTEADHEKARTDKKRAVGDL